MILKNAIKNKAIEFAKKGASAFIVYNSGIKDDELKFEGKQKSDLKNSRCIILQKMLKKYLSDKSANLEIRFQVAIGDKKRTATM